MVSRVVPEECAGGTVKVCVRVVSEAVGVVPEVVLVPAAVSLSVVVLDVKAIAKTSGAVSVVGAVSLWVASSVRLVAACCGQCSRVRLLIVCPLSVILPLPLFLEPHLPFLPSQGRGVRDFSLW